MQEDSIFFNGLLSCLKPRAQQAADCDADLSFSLKSLWSKAKVEYNF